MRLRAVMMLAVMLAALTALPRSAAADVGEEKAGPLMGNFKLAPAVGFGRLGFHGTQFAMQLEIAYAVDSDNAAYIGFNPQFQFWDVGAIINLTGTFQYDIELPTKVKGLYIYPKINAGLAIFPGESYYYYGCGPGRQRCLYAHETGVAFTLQPEVGVKFNIFKNFHVLGEPLSFPIYIGEFTFAQWRFWFGAGFDV